MSNIYITEPPTNGKVLLRTSVGEIEIELWSKECPKAARNFVQLCMENYYDNTSFHRLVPDFIVQGGDPTGTGEGGESIYGKPFRTETHSRLRFNRRGLVAMAAPEANDNRSQFFFTLAATPELDRKHTIFGKVVGNTLYNMINLNSDEVDQNERPVRLHRIFKTEVISNPFPDIEPRASKKVEEEKEGNSKPKSTARATKNFKLLSFGGEAEEEEEELSQAASTLPRRGKSSHDLLDDPRLSKDAVAVDSKAAAAAAAALAAARAKAAAKAAEEEAEERRKRMAQREEAAEEKSRVRQEIDCLQRELKRKAKGPQAEEEGLDQKRTRQEEEEAAEKDPVKEFMLERKKFKEQRKPSKKSTRERETMAIFESFRAKLVATAGAANGDKEEEEEAGGMGQLDKYLAHRMIAEEKAPVLAMDASSAKDHERYDLYDPRNPLNVRRRGEKEKKRKE